ncbi:MAG: type II secretion system minor pseudopilin GspI [Pseudomonadota bacterium]
MSAARQSGFSLVEMLAALAVLAIAGLALMNAVTQSGRAAGMARDAAFAHAAAENLMNQALLDADPQLGVRDSDGDYELAGRQYAWRIEVSRTSQPGLQRVLLTLSDEGEARILAELTTFKRVGGS